MDPLSALSVAGTISQFVDFGTKMLSSGMELYKSTKGSLKVSEELELATGDLQAVLVKLRTSAGPENSTPPAPSPQSQAEIDKHRDSFLEICNNATLIAGELLRKLNDLKVKDGKHRGWQTLRAAIKTAWSKCFIVTINTRDWSIVLFNWSIPYLIDQCHVLRLLLFNWLVSMGFIIRFKGASSPLTACAPHACALHLTSLLNFYYFTSFTSSINRNCLSDYL
jgi:hypothetical protein